MWMISDIADVPFSGSRYGPNLTPASNSTPPITFVKFYDYSEIWPLRSLSIKHEDHTIAGNWHRHRTQHPRKPLSSFTEFWWICSSAWICSSKGHTILGNGDRHRNQHPRKPLLSFTEFWWICSCKWFCSSKGHIIIGNGDRHRISRPRIPLSSFTQFEELDPPSNWQRTSVNGIEGTVGPAPESAATSVVLTWDPWKLELQKYRVRGQIHSGDKSALLRKMRKNTHFYDFLVEPVGGQICSRSALVGLTQTRPKNREKAPFCAKCAKTHIFTIFWSSLLEARSVLGQPS